MSEDFDCVKKGFFPERERVKEEILDDFSDSEEGRWGINGKSTVKKAIVDEPIDQVFDESISEDEAAMVDSLLKKLQAEADVFLVEDFSKGQRISLEESIYLALRDNEGVGFGNASALETNITKGITSAYLDREVAKQGLLATLEGVWTPTWDTVISTIYTRQYFRDAPYVTTVQLPSPSISTNQRLKSGGNIAMAWTNNYSYVQTAGRHRNTIATTNLSFLLTQPLLKGGGFAIGTIPLTRAYLADESSINNLKSTIIDNITQTITLYRAYLRAIDAFEIDKRAIYKGREDLANTKILVDAGRRARADIVERQRYLATQEFQFQDQRNEVDRARISFLRQLNMDTSTNLVPEDLFVLDIEPEDMPQIEELMTIALLYNPNYLNQLISFRNSELDYQIARNNTLWQLDFTAGISASGSRTIRRDPVSRILTGFPISSLGRSNEKAWDFRDRAVTTGLTLTIPFNKVEQRKLDLLNAKVALRNAKIDLRKREEDLKASIKDLLRSIKKDIIQIKIAKINTALSRKRVLQKRIEIDAGLSSSFELTGVSDDLINAEKAELDAKINFMNDIALLDQQLGTTPETWNINLKRRTDNLPRLNDTLFGKIKTENV